MILLSILYQILILALSIIAIPFFFFTKRGREGIWERYGFWNIPSNFKNNEIIWLHGASAGELQGLIPLIEKYKRESENFKILVTCTSDAGKKVVESRSDIVRFLPLESWLYYFIAFRDLKCVAFIGSETEIWPGLLSWLKIKKVSSFVINGRISDITIRKYRLFKFYISYLLSVFKLIFVSDAISQKRFEEFSVKKVLNLGNIKYERKTPKFDREEIRKKIGLNSDDVLITIGSIRPGEEEILFPVISNLREKVKFKFLIAPRHIERSRFFAERLKSSGIQFGLRSKENTFLEFDTIILDTFGELECFYSISEIALIGGTWIDIGGHNPIEAAQFGVPVVVGRYTHVIDDILTNLIDEAAGFKVTTKGELFEILISLIEDSNFRKQAGLSSLQIVSRLNGSTDKIFKELNSNI